MHRFRNIVVLSTFLTAVGLTGAANATVVSLNFEGVNALYPSAFAFVDGFYNGGTSSDGTSGTNYGIAFSSTAQAICLNTPGTTCSNTSRGGLAPGSEFGGLFFLDPLAVGTFMNIAGGFDTGFSFNYTAIKDPGLVQVWSGLNGTGALLASLVLGLTPSTCDGVYSAGFCPFVAGGIGFLGTAMSVLFGGVANQIVFDDITFGSVTPGPDVPLPPGLPLLASGLAGLVLARRIFKRRAGSGSLRVAA